MIAFQRGFWFGGAAIIAVAGLGAIAAWKPLAGKATRVIDVQRPLTVGLSTAQLAVVASLDKRVTAKFQATPLQEALSILGRKVDVPFLLDADALEQAGIEAKEPVTLDLRDVPLDQAIGLVIERFGFKYCLGGDGILVTDRETAENRVFARLYPIADIAMTPTRWGEKFAGREIANLIQDTLSPETWHTAEGPGFATAEPVSFSLVVSQSLAVHREIEAFLAQLRRSRAQLDAFCQAARLPAPTKLWKDHFSRQQELVEMFEAMIDLEADDAALPNWAGQSEERELLPTAARRLAAKALAFAATVEGEIAEEEDLDGSKAPLLVRRRDAEKRPRARSTSPAGRWVSGKGSVGR